MDCKEQSIIILGRQPALGIAELESLYGADVVVPFSSDACLLTAPTEKIDLNRLGGSMRLARILMPFPTNSWKDIESYLIEKAPGRAQSIEGKLSFGLSVYGVKTSPAQIARTALSMKKAIKQPGNSVRMVPHKDMTLGSATVLYNKLTSKNGWELLIISNGKKTYLAQTTAIQDIDAYSARDQARPMRDAKVGMLPPKLAQIVINLATGEKLSAQTGLSRAPLILDPFCGTGVLLQEATLMDYDVYGTDIEPRMIRYTVDNLTWLDTKYPNAGDYRRIEIGDATTFKWDFSKFTTHPPAGGSELVIATETFLGKPLATLPPGDQLSSIIYDANLINHKFLQNIAPQLTSGTRLCLAVPAWRGKHEFLHLPMLDHLTDMGYTRRRLKHVSNDKLIYHRENQVVARELLVLIKN